MRTLDLETQPLLTTVVGSYPADDLPPRRAIARAVEDQIAAGVDLISDGQVRGDMIAVFAGRIPGLTRASDGIWEVEAALDLPDGPITVADFVLARELAAGRAAVKAVVTGPITLAAACRVLSTSPYLGPQDPSLLLRLAEILGREVAALVASGAAVVQVDEPALGTSLGTSLTGELIYDALRDLAALPRWPMLHVCGDIRAIAGELLVLPFAILDFENTATHEGPHEPADNLAAFDHEQVEFADVRLSVGCVDTRTPTVDALDVIRARVRRAASLVAPERLWISPDCGLRALPRDAAREKLARMVAAVRDVRAKL